MNSDQPEIEVTKLANFTPQANLVELQIIDIKPGSGEIVGSGATITAHYTGALAGDGTIFQSSHDFGEPITFSLTQVIKGWSDGVPGMRVGGVRRLLIPTLLAYGKNSPSPDIPANADLVFDIELISI